MMHIINGYIGLSGAIGLIVIIGISIFTIYKSMQKKRITGLLLFCVILFLFTFNLTNKFLMYPAAFFILLNTVYYIVFFVQRCKTNREENETNQTSHPRVTIIIPAKDEDKVIYDTLDSISRLDYPESRYDVIVIDDNSKDDTFKLASSFSKIKNMKIIKNERSLGKSISLNNLVNSLDSEYILFMDADHLIDKHFLNHALSHFKDSKVAGVQGINSIRNGKSSLLSKLVEMEYLNRYTLIYGGKSITTFMGSGGIFRLDILREVKGFNIDMLTEDLELSYRIYQHGYKIIFDDSIATYELATIDYKNFFKQRHRWFRGIWQSFGPHLNKMMRLKTATLRNKFDFFHMIIENLSLSSFLYFNILFTLDLFNWLEFDLKIVLYLKIVVLLFLSLTAIFKSKKFKNLLFLPLILYYYLFYSFPNVMAKIDNWILKKEYKWIKTDRSNFKVKSNSLEA